MIVAFSSSCAENLTTLVSPVYCHIEQQYKKELYLKGQSY